MQEKFYNNKMTIENNYRGGWEYQLASKEDLVYVYLEDDDSNITFGISDIPFIIKALTEIKTYYENIPQKRDKVEFIKGRMIGLTGIIADIDECDNERPVAVKIDDNDDINDCTYFCNYDDVKVLK